MTIPEIINSYRKVAVYGMSTNPSKHAFIVPEVLLKNGFEIYPINPMADEILGQKSYKSLIDVEQEIEILDVFRPSEQVPDIVREAIERKKAKGDIKVIWLQEGIISEEAERLAKENGFEFVQNKCIKIEFLNFG
ncbi:MAG: hypothetical protein A2X64_00995 [Ignavibacteria bacterium GWF2_33_9]|nr:MAG: hypothetical protein A2X64_00995 [Ignavibacteria bacterium GWF2_33_9]